MRPRALVTSLFAASLALVPSATADAATHSASVKVKVIGRSGKTVVATIDLVDVSTGARFTVAAGKAKSVPTGTYVIGSYIAEGRKVTLAARTVHVDGNKSLTFDARDGRKVTASVDQKHTKLRRVDAAVSVHTAIGDVPMDMTGVLDPDERPTVYAIPSPGGRARLSLDVTLTSATVSPSPWRFDLARTSKGVPKKLAVTGKKAELARVDLDLHTPDPDLTRWVDLAPMPASGWFAGEITTGQAPQPTGLAAPQHLRSYRTPGWWETTFSAAGHGRGAQVTEFGARDSGNKPVPYRSGRAYAETWGSGVWGVNAPDLMFISGGGKFYGEAFSPLCPANAGGVHPDMCETDATALLRLYRGASLVAAGDDLMFGVPVTAGWYDVALDGHRHAGAAASTSFSARWHVHVDGATANRTELERGLISLAAGGLNGHNAAPKSSTTRVTMSVDGFDAIASEDLAYSTDGTTWNPVTLTKSGANWVADVPNPSTPGGISLRANAAGASGSTVSETITNAWRVE